MVVEVNFDSANIRPWLLFLGGCLSFVAWFTRDEQWSLAYWWSWLRGRRGEVHIQSEQMGGLSRGKYILIGGAILALGIAWPWIVESLGIVFTRI
jgi:hypothetical protein